MFGHAYTDITAKTVQADCNAVVNKNDGSRTAAQSHNCHNRFFGSGTNVTHEDIEKACTELCRAHNNTGNNLFHPDRYSQGEPSRQNMSRPGGRFSDDNGGYGQLCVPKRRWEIQLGHLLAPTDTLGQYQEVDAYRRPIECHVHGQRYYVFHTVDIRTRQLVGGPTFRLIPPRVQFATASPPTFIGQMLMWNRVTRRMEYVPVARF
jgi:hypothetical protein